ncbi:putative Heat shock transcription factor family [Helianthus debilis subsp. tardiflorus]
MIGFRKIDTDRWEFACESFLKGKRHLLKNIRRRRSLPAQQLTEESSSLSVEAEVERLQKERIEMMREVIDLQDQQRGTHQYMEAVNQKLQAAEDRQKQMVSSLAKVFQIPKFKKELHRISSQQKARKFIKHQPDDHVSVDKTETAPLRLHDLDLQELAQVNDRFPKEELDFSFDYDAATIVKQEDLWSSDLEAVSAMPNNMWNDVGNYEHPEFGTPGGELSDFWNLADSGAENWLSGEPSKSRKTDKYGF